MKIQEALTQIKELKADAIKLIREASRKKTRTVYLDVDAEIYKKEKGSIDAQIDDAIGLLADAHELKLAVQRANVKHGLVVLIQEADLLKSMCTHFSGYEGVEQETDPTVGSFFARSSTSPTFEVQQANFNTDKMDADFARWQDRIREINAALQEKNWEIEIESVGPYSIRKFL